MLTIDQIKKRFRVNPETGDIFGKHKRTKPLGWIKPGNRRDGGGYWMISIFIDGKGRHIRAHHIVWTWVYGEWPQYEIDHINGNRADNRICNLRSATIHQNRSNKVRGRNNKSGYKWVFKNTKESVWRAEVRYSENGVSKRFKTFGHKTPEEAYEIASRFAKSVHGEFYNQG